jgi:hypothetical protein
VPQTEASLIAVDSTSFSRARAFDGDPETAWIPGGSSPVSWIVYFGESIPVNEVDLQFRGQNGPQALPDYTISALWEGTFVPLLMPRQDRRSAELPRFLKLLISTRQPGSSCLLP